MTPSPPAATTVADAADPAPDAADATPDDLFRRAVALARAGRATDARVLLETVVTRTPGDARPAFSLGLMAQAGGDPATAERWFREALRRDRHHATAWFTLGALLAGQRRNREAAVCFRNVLRRVPEHADSHANLATVLSRLKKDEDALYHYHRAVELKPDDPGRRYQFAIALHRLHRLDEAAVQFRAVLDRRPDDLDALYNLGVTLPPLRREAEAAACFERILQRDPLNTGASYQLGRLEIARGRVAAAVTLLRRAHVLEPDHAEALRHLVRAMLLDGGADAEETLLRRIAAIDPEDGSVLRRLGELALAGGRDEEALERYLAALDADPDREGSLGAIRPILDRLGRGGDYAAIALAKRSNYQLWLDEHHTLDDGDRRAIAARIAAMTAPPRFSVIMPVYNPPAEYLDAAIRSVRDQLYPHWELCIADDASTDPEIRRVLEAHAAAEPRVRVVFRPVNGHIAAASNSALALATGSHVAFLDHDDLFTEDALYHMAEALIRHPDAELIYSDNDTVDEHGIRFRPHFKGGWDPDLFYAQNYVTHLSVYRLDRVRAVGGLREGYEGSQDWDLTLRVVEGIRPDRIHHVPFLLYHWRAIAGSTAAGAEAKPYCVDAAVRAMTDHFARTGQAVTRVEPTTWGYRVVRPLPDPAPRVSVIVPTRDRMDFLGPCVEGVLSGTDYPDVELIVIDNGSREPETLAFLADLERTGRGRVLRDDGPFNYAALNNAAAALATGTVLCFLNNDTEPAGRGWLAEMVSQAVRPEIGAVGAKLLYRDRTVQHVGVLTGIWGIAAHYNVGLPREHPGYFCRSQLIHAASAVTGACLVTRKAVFDAVGGFDAENFHVNYNDVDLCLTIGAAGYRVLMNPYAELFHYESASRGIFLTPAKKALLEEEGERLLAKWGDRLANDPYYNPNQSMRVPFARAEEPRLVRPWRAPPTREASVG
ncbi:glycosyltransferase [Azospirillum halopraeferens]|uniref:glycosyltransferase n=1 Tax=Azospirillum halopraeferens TaxID=34010 RepID=UPI0003FBC94E|nr:glycosyltransferase [Azospirillum halopraeferens]